MSALGDAFVMAAAGTVGATITPDSQIPGAAGSSVPPNTGTALGGAIGGAALGSGLGAGQPGGYVPNLYDVPGGTGDRRVRYW